MGLGNIKQHAEQENYIFTSLLVAFYAVQLQGIQKESANRDRNSSDRLFCDGLCSVTPYFCICCGQTNSVSLEIVCSSDEILCILF